MSDRFLELVNPAANLSHRHHLFNRLNPCQRGGANNNCDAAAAVLFDYLESGVEHQALCIEIGGEVIETDRRTGRPATWIRVPGLRALVYLLKRGGHGTHLIVLGLRPPTSQYAQRHVFNLMNVDFPNGTRRRNQGGVHLADAYSNEVIPTYPNPTVDQSVREIGNYLTANEIPLGNLSYRTSSYNVTRPQTEQPRGELLRGR